MAEVILTIVGTAGIVKAVVGILTKLAADEIVLLWNGEEDLRMLIETLKTIDAATATAEKLQVSDASVRLWLKRLKDIAYDIEDLAAEVSYETMRHRERGIGKKARDLFSSDKVSYAVVKKVQDINKRLDWVTKNNNYSKLPIETHTETSLQSFDRETSPRVPQSIEGREADKNEILRILITSGERSFISFDQHQQNDRFYKYIKELKNYIAGLFFSLLGIAGLFYRARSSVASSSAASSSSSSSASNFQNNQYPENVSVVSIVGMGGVGKTTLAGLIYKDEAVESFNPKIWVCVAGDFVARTVLLQILKFIIPETNLNNSSALVTLENQVEQQLRGKKYLLVLDDMWNVRADEWEKLTRVLTAGVLAGSKVLITSREVQKSVNGGIPSYKLKQLEDEECWLIIKSKAFLDGGAQQTGGDMMRIGREIAKKCMGLPLAAQSLGSLMHSKNRKEWEMIRDNDIWNDKEKDQFNIIPILKLSYDDYPSELKQCFSYCSIFPKNWEISKVTLVQLWIAEGFLGTCKLEKGRSIEDFADKFFDRLVWSSFLDGVQRSTLDDIVTCKMHDLVHDLAKAVVGDQELTSLKVSELHNTSEIRRLHLTLDEELSASSLNCLSTAKKLRTLFIPENSKLDPSMFSENHYLRVLHVGLSPNLAFSKLPSLSVNLKHLRYLRLTSLDQRKLKNNRSISKLHNLETLVLTNSYGVQNLLSNIQLSQKLRYLELSFTDMVELPDSITSLINLQTLDLNHSELKAIPDSISGLKNLRFLNLSFNPIKELPVSVANLSSLETVAVNSCKNLKALPEEVEGLANLRIFDLKECPLLEALPEDFGELYQLRSLDLVGSPIRVLPESCTSLKNLEYVELYHCELPKYVKNWTKLKKFRYYGRKNPPVMLGVGELVYLEELVYTVPQKLTNETGCNFGIEELGNLKFLQRLDIRDLQNAQDQTDAKRVNLKGKQNLHMLNLVWSNLKDELAVWDVMTQEWRNNVYKKSCNIQVFEALQPPLGLKSLAIVYFMGWDHPTWMCAPSCLPNLQRLYLTNCMGFEQLPAAVGKLPHLRYLFLNGIPLKNLDIGGFLSLLRLECVNMDLLEELCVPYPCLQILIIDGCESLSTITCFPSLKELLLEKIDLTLLSSIGRSHTSLTRIVLNNIMGLIFFPVIVLKNNCNLQTLEIKDCDQFRGFQVNDDHNENESPKFHIGSLRKLSLINCPVLEFLPYSRGGSTSLQQLTISNCPKVGESLTYDRLECVSSLTNLYVDSVPLKDGYVKK